VIIVRISHIRTAKICMSGARDWFKQYDLSWSDFLQNGLPVEVMEATQHPLALRVCRIARQEAELTRG
jgi:hypothetical protein